MQLGTHARTWIAILRDYVEEWRKANGWSRETVAELIVKAHDAIDGPRTTGIAFDPPTRDTFERMRVNADRVFRWLDDVSKDRNHLPSNFVVSILAALPDDLRMHAVDDLLRPVGLASRHIAAQPAASLDNVVHLFRSMLTESAEANLAMADLLENATDPVLKAAQKEISESLTASQRSLAAVEAELATRAQIVPTRSIV